MKVRQVIILEKGKQNDVIQLKNQIHGEGDNGTPLKTPND